MTVLLPERMTDTERAHTELLLAGCLLDEFRTLLNPELARIMAKYCVDKIAVFQTFKGKQL